MAASLTSAMASTGSSAASTAGGLIRRRTNSSSTSPACTATITRPRECSRWNPPTSRPDGGGGERAGPGDPAVHGEQPGDDERRHHRVDHRDARVEGGGRQGRRRDRAEQRVRAAQPEQAATEQVRQRQQRRVHHRVDQLDDPVAVGEVPVPEERRRDQHRVADPAQQVVLAAEAPRPAGQRAGGVQVAVLVGVRDGQHDVPGQPHPPGHAEHPADDQQQRHQPTPARSGPLGVSATTTGRSITSLPGAMNASRIAGRTGPR